MTNPITRRAREFANGLEPYTPLTMGERILTACQDQFGKLPELPDPDAEDMARVRQIVDAVLGAPGSTTEALRSAIPTFRQVIAERGEKS